MLVDTDLSFHDSSSQSQGSLGLTPTIINRCSAYYSENTFLSSNKYLCILREKIYIYIFSFLKVFNSSFMLNHCIILRSISNTLLNIKVVASGRSLWLSFLFVSSEVTRHEHMAIGLAGPTVRFGNRRYCSMIKYMLFPSPLPSHPL